MQASLGGHDILRFEPQTRKLRIVLRLQVDPVKNFFCEDGKGRLVFSRGLDRCCQMCVTKSKRQRSSFAAVAWSVVLPPWMYSAPSK